MDLYPLISVIVPVYNVAPYLEECLDSIARQSYCNFEVILVDDGSTDNSGEICDTYCGKDNRFRVIHQENQWVSGARNTGLREAAGEWLCFIDSDDFVDSEYLMALYQKTSEGYLLAVVDVSCPPFESCFNDGEIDSDSIFKKLFPISNDSSIKEKVVYSVVWNKFYHRSLLDGLHFKDLPAGEDKEFNCRVYLMVDKVGLVNLPLYHYRHRENSIMRSLEKEQNVDYRRFKLCEELLASFRFPDSCKTCRTWLLRTAFSYMIYARLKAWPSQLDRDWKNDCRSVIEKYWKEFLLSKLIPQKQRLAFFLYWYFPFFGKALSGIS